MDIFVANVQLRLNQHGGCYDSGRSYSDVLRERVLDLAHAGTIQRQIATELRVSRGYVQKVLEQHNVKNISIRSPRTSFFSQKLPTKSSSLCLLRKLESQAFVPLSYEKDFY